MASVETDESVEDSSLFLVVCSLLVLDLLSLSDFGDFISISSELITRYTGAGTGATYCKSEYGCAP